MFDQLKSAKQTKWLAEAFSTLPEAHITPAAAYRELVLDNVEHVELRTWPAACWRPASCRIRPVFRC